MAVFTKVYSFTEALSEKKHNLGSDALTVALTNSSNPPLVTNTVLADLTQVSYTNLSTRVITVSSSSQTLGDYSLVANDLTLTASGAVASFRYVVIYNDTATNDELIGWYDYGTDVTLGNGDTFLVDFSASGAITLT